MIGGASLPLPAIAAAGVRARALEPGGPARRLHRPPLLLCSLAFIAGAAVAVWGANPAAVYAGLAATAAACLAAAWQTPARNRRNRLNFALLLLAPAAFYAGYWHADRSAGATAELAMPADQEVSISGVAVRDPVARFGGIDLRLRVDRVMLGGESAAADAVVQVRVPPGSAAELGDRIAARTVLEPIAGGADDYFAHLEREGVAAEARAGGVQRDAAAGESGMRGAFLDARGAVSDALARALPPPLDGVAQAMVTGRRSSIDPHRREQLADTGLIHLVVVSGSNITLIAAFFIAASSWLIGRRPASGLALAAVLFYAVFASVGLDAPIFRASVMAAVLVAAAALGRGLSVSVALTLAAAVIVAVDPTALASASFQLSFAGTMAIALVAPGVINRVMAGGDGIAGTLRDLLILHMLATIATLPVIAIHMGEIPLVSVPANLLVAPFFAWMFIGSGAVALAGLASGGLAQFLAWPLSGAPLSWLMLVAEHGSSPPFSAVPVPRFGLAHLLVVYAGLAIAAIRVRSWRETRTEQPKWRRSPAAPAFAAIALAGAAAAIGFALAASDERPAVHFLDVGQGDASLIRTDAGRTLLIDGGPDGAALFAALDDVLPANSAKLDAVVLTHPQMDHAGGLFAVIERYEVGQLIVSPANARWPLGSRLERAARERGIPIRQAAHGDLISFDGDDLPIDVLWPMRDGSIGDDPNAASLVLRAALGNAVFLFTGDIRAKEELGLARATCSGGLPCDLRADVLKVAHQGSRSSSTDLFLRRAAPEIAVISAGAGNPHRHPHPEAVARLQRAGARVFTTARHGTISVFPDGSVRVHRDPHAGLP